MSYKVETQHRRPIYRKGDLEDELAVIDCKVFKTRKEAKSYIESKLRNYRKVTRDYHKGNTPSSCVAWTGKEWQHENAGHMCSEYYRYILSKL